MRQFYIVYQGDRKVSTLLRQLTWSHNLLIISKCKIREEREFYLRLAVKENYSFRQLERQIDSCLFERAVTSPVKVSSLMSQLYPPALEVFKDSYILDFLNLPESHSEEELQKGLVRNLRKFLLELGRDFCFVSEEYRLQIGGKDFFIDLLFFHRGLSCLVAFELKIDDFKPEYLGKLAFYLKALDKNDRKENENPSVGVLLCKSKDSEIVEFSLSSSLAPALVAEYQTKLPDKKLLESKLHEFYELNKLEGDIL
jgi:predicted nuclease of restriction endonuclease-like (RecB) superfamily